MDIGKETFVKSEEGGLDGPNAGPEEDDDNEFVIEKW